LRNSLALNLVRREGRKEKGKEGQKKRNKIKVATRSRVQIIGGGKTKEF
jgi:hypothetical protein